MKIKLLITGSTNSQNWKNKTHLICYGKGLCSHYSYTYKPLPQHINTSRFEKWEIEPI